MKCAGSGVARIIVGLVLVLGLVGKGLVGAVVKYCGPGVRIIVGLVVVVGKGVGGRAVVKFDGVAVVIVIVGLEVVGNEAAVVVHSRSGREVRWSFSMCNRWACSVRQMRSRSSREILWCRSA